ncbi:MAG: hypothetical protein ACE5OZ_20455 [Candidatus Heimdallarchaeota archaeon]
MMIAWILIEPVQERNILYIMLMVSLYGMLFVGVGFFLVNSFLLGIVAFTGDLSEPEKKWVRRHVFKHSFFSLGWAAAVLLTITATKDLRVSMVVNTAAVAVLFMYGNFYRDLDKMPSEIRRAIS